MLANPFKLVSLFGSDGQNRTADTWFFRPEFFTLVCIYSLPIISDQEYG